MLSRQCLEHIIYQGLPPTDYIRTFTLDKRVEMFLKKTAGKTLPTVVYPELYRKRFCEAMDKYFTVVPDKWTGLGADVKY